MSYSNEGEKTVDLKKYKVVLLGEHGTGKSSLVVQFVYGKKLENYNPTIGIDFYSKNIDINERIVRLQIWDTAGQERFRALLPSYVRDSDVAIIVFDLTCEKSFSMVEYWLKYIKKSRGDGVKIILVGNKCDLVDERKININSCEKLAKKWDFIYTESSAFSADEAKRLFVLAANLVMDLCKEDKNIAESVRSIQRMKMNHCSC